jgi:hypothetical protein
MVFSIIIFSYRKSGTTPEQFKTYYERSHIPLVRELAGDDFPLSHTRYYVQRTFQHPLPSSSPPSETQTQSQARSQDSDPQELQRAPQNNISNSTIGRSGSGDITSTNISCVDNALQTLATVFVGSQEDFQYDAFAKLTFEDEAGFARFFNLMHEKSVVKEMVEGDEEKFLDRERMRVVILGDVIETSRDEGEDDGSGLGATGKLRGRGTGYAGLDWVDE